MKRVATTSTTSFPSVRWVACLYNLDYLVRIFDPRYGQLHLDEILSDVLYTNAVFSSKEEVEARLRAEYPDIEIVASYEYNSFCEEEMRKFSQYIRAFAKERGWTPMDTSYACRQCESAIHWKFNPDFGHSNPLYGSTSTQEAHCTKCPAVYTQTVYHGYTYLDSKEPLPPDWTVYPQGEVTKEDAYEYTPQSRSDYRSLESFAKEAFQIYSQKSQRD